MTDIGKRMEAHAVNYTAMSRVEKRLWKEWVNIEHKSIFGPNREEYRKQFQNGFRTFLRQRVADRKQADEIIKRWAAS